MEKGPTNKTVPTKNRDRKTIIAGENPIAIIPIVLVLNGIGIDVPTVIVPVDVDRTKHSYSRGFYS